jgi:hypothetical protein
VLDPQANQNSCYFPPIFPHIPKKNWACRHLNSQAQITDYTDCARLPDIYKAMIRLTFHLVIPKSAPGRLFLLNLPFGATDFSDGVANGK